MTDSFSFLYMVRSNFVNIKKITSRLVPMACRFLIAFFFLNERDHQNLLRHAGLG